jgi:predicted GNAT superfamily acetyltransferase
MGDMKKPLLFCAVLLTVSCTVPERYVIYQAQERQKESPSPYQKVPDTTTDDRGVRFTGGDGSSMEKAIIISGANNEIEAVPAEIAYISRRLGERDKSWKMTMQNNFRENGRIYVEYQIEDLEKGTKAAYFFDNTSLYSAFLENTGTPPVAEQPQKVTPIPYQTAGEKGESSRIRYGGGDGTSMEKAIFVYGAKNEEQAVQAEIDYISRKHGEKDRYWKKILQSNFRKDSRNYAEYQIEDHKNGMRTAYIFDDTPSNSAFAENAGAPLTPEPLQKETRSTYQPAVEKTENRAVRFTGGNGSSIKNAIIIIGPKNEKEVMEAEIDYISKKHGVKDKYWKVLLQSNFRKNDNHYNEFNIKELGSGGRFSYCFDVTAVYR